MKQRHSTLARLTKLVMFSVLSVCSWGPHIIGHMRHPPSSLTSWTLKTGTSPLPDEHLGPNPFLGPHGDPPTC